MSTNDTKTDAGAHDVDATNLRLERAALGELGAAEMAGLDDDERAEIERIRAANAAELAAYPPAQEVANIRRKLDGTRRRTRGRRLGAFVAAVPVAAALMLTVMSGPSATTEVPTERTKGPPVLQVFRKADNEQERLRSGARAAPGDVLQLRYDARGRKFGVIVSIDGAGVVTPHLPDRLQGEAASLDRALVTLASAYELDDAPGFERFFMVTADTPFDVSTVASAVRRVGGGARTELDLDDSLTQVVLHLDKERR